MAQYIQMRALPPYLIMHFKEDVHWLMHFKNRRKVAVDVEVREVTTTAPNIKFKIIMLLQLCSECVVYKVLVLAFLSSDSVLLHLEIKATHKICR